MADPREFVLIGNFVDNISPALVKINKSLEQVKNTLESVTKVTKPLNKEFKELSDTAKNFSSSIKGQAADIREITAAMKAMRSEMGRVNRAYRAAGRNRNILPPPPPPPRAPRTALPPPPPPPRTPRTAASGYGRRGGSPPPPPPIPPSGGRQSVMGDVISGNLISNAIIQGFQVGVGILQQGMSAAFGAFAERAKDQLEDIGAAGGIFSAGQFANIPGFPKTFQGAMEMQDKINKEMATIASTLPGTTHDYVQNSRRLVDTTAQIMSRDMKGFMSLATELTGKMNMSAEEAFQVVNVEVAKATTMLEKLNPAKTVIPMTQLVEDMMKDEKVTIGGLRRYVSFRRSTTFEAALQRNIDELNKTGAGTAARLKMIIKVLKQAAPPEMVGAFQSSVAGVVEGFRSALMDPDVGIFGLSRTLSLQVKKFDRETGKYIGTEFTNFFKLFGEVFGNLGNLINNSIMPGLQALYEPFKAIAEQFVKLRETSYEIFRRQQEYSAYFDSLADKYGMRREDFKVFEKGGVSVLMDILQGFNMLDKGKYESIMKKMKAKGTAEEVAKNMKEVYADIIPAIFESPFFKNIGTTLGKALASVFKEIAKIMKALLGGQYGTSEFLKAFYDAGGMDAINEILMYVAEGIGKILMGIAQAYIGALTKAIGSGNFAAAGVLGALGLVFGAPAIAGIKIIASGMQLLVNAFKVLLNARRVIPTTVQDLGSRITDPSRMLPAAKETALATTKAGPLAKGMGAFGKFFMNFGNYIKGVGPRFMGFFKGFLGKLTIFGGVVTSIISLFQGKDLATALAEGVGPVLGAALGAALIPFLGPIGPMIGSAIGGWIGSMKPVVNALRGVFSALLWGFDQLKNSLGPAVEAVSGVFSTLFNIVKGIIPGLDSFGEGLSVADALFIGLKLAMFPFISALNGAVAAVLLLKIALLEFDKWINNTFQWGDRQGRIQDEIEKTWAQMGKVAEIQEKMNADLLKKLPTTDQDRKVGTKAVLGGKEVTWDGKAWKPAGAPPPKPALKPSPKPGDINAAITALGGNPKAPLSTPKIVPTPKKPGGYTPSPQNQDPVFKALSSFFGGAWKTLTTTPSQTGAKPDPYGPSAVKPPATPVAQAAAKAPKEVIATAQNTTEINNKAATQVTQGAAVQKSSDEVKKNTATANVSLGNIRSGLMSISNKLTGIQNAMLGDLNNIQAGVNSVSSLLSSGQLKVQASFPGMMPGGPMGGAPGGLGAAQQMASQYGLQLTSWFRPGDKGMHGVGRAMDFSNGVSTPQQMAFAQAMVAQYGSSLKELIYTPLGFGIKDGTPVPLSYWGARTNAMHYNHVHVAFAEGAERGRMFTNQRAAGGWEESMVPGSVKVSSITGNSAEGFGGNTVGDIHVTVNAGATNDPDQLAYMVAVKIQEAVGDAVNSNILV